MLDAGCGTGQVTARLRDRLPSGHVVALDRSPSMIDAARERLGRHRMSHLVHDLLEPIPLDSVDAIVPTATFHWVPDHGWLFDNLAAVPRGLGHDLEWQKVVPGPEETTERLEAVGFEAVRCWLVDEPTVLPREDLELYLRTVCVGGILDDLPADEAEDLVRKVAARMDEPRIDYVRLNIDARRAR